MNSKKLHTEKTRIKDVAVCANVSVGTVDRVIHNRSEVSEKTRSRVMKIVKELNYQPDVLASALASKKKIRLATLIPESNNDSKFWLAPVKGFSRAMREFDHFDFGIDQYLFNQHDKKSFERSCASILMNKPDAVIVAPVFEAAAGSFCEQLYKAGIPWVFINSNLEGCQPLGFIGQDSFQSGRVAARLLTYGINPEFPLFIFNFLKEKSNYNHIVNREKGFRSYFITNKQFEKQINIQTITNSDNENIEKLFYQAMDKVNNRAGIFVTNSKVYKIAKLVDTLPNRNIRLIGYDLLDENREWLQKGIIDFLISQKPEEQGYKAVVSLMNHLVYKREVEFKQPIPIDIITKENIEYYNN